MAWSLSPAEYALTVEKIAKINARAAKRGFTGLLEVIGERTEETYVNEVGLETTEIVYKTTISGEPPKYNGWQLLAALDFEPGGLIVRTAPGIESINRDGLEPGKCDHCGHNRQRRYSYVVSDGTKTLQVGSTCLKDFLGWSASVCFIDTEEASETIGGFCGTGERTFAVETVLAAAWAAIKTDGFVPASDYSRTPTKITVCDILMPPRAEKRAREIRERYGQAFNDAPEMAAKVRSFILSDDFNGGSEYVTNLKVLCGSEEISPRHFGLLASAPQAMAKAQERTLIREREKSEIVNEYVGTVKERITIQAKVKAVRWIDSDWGSTTLYTLVSKTGHVFKWFASKDALGEEPTEEYQEITGTIKKHDEYNGMKSTVLTRCKVG